MVPPYWQLYELLFRLSYWGTWCPRESKMKAAVPWFPPIGSFMNTYLGCATGEPGAQGSPRVEGCSAMVPPYWQLYELLFRLSCWGTWYPRESMW